LLKAIHGDDVSDVWVAALLADVDQVFGSAGYQEQVAGTLTARLKAVPPTSVATLATLMHTAKADAAMSLVAADFMWAQASFNQSVCDDALAALRKTLPPASEQAP
jgi:hypothetical protein